MVNTICHIEIGVRDSKRAEEFYSKVFDWKMEPKPHVTMIRTGDDLGGHFDKQGPSPNYTIFYVMVDDKARILSATKQLHPDRFVTIHVRQGHYGRSPDRFPIAPDLTIEQIGDLRALDLAALRSHLA